MALRSHESPMDWEWQTHGPADASSPFHKLAMDHRQNQNRQKEQENLAKKRTHSVFDSSSKPAIPALREPTSQTFLFSQPASTKAAPPFRNPSFATPRKFEAEMFSSGPENPSSPENADGEDTPDQPSKSAATKPSTVITEFKGVPIKERTQPHFGRFGGGSPGRGKVPRGKFSDAIVKKVHKRRRREAEKDQIIGLRRPSDDSESDNPGSGQGNSEQDRASVQSTSWFASFLAFIETHPALPHVLSFYAQLLLNIFLVFCFIYIVYSFWATIRGDVDKKSQEVVLEAMLEISVCAKSYVDNKCDHGTRVPAMETVCNNWKSCMDRDPNAVGRARVSAHTFAEIFNSFIEPISYKAMIFSLVLVFGCIAISNMAFSIFRSKANPHPPASYAQPQQHHPQQHMYSNNGYEPSYTPYRGQLGYDGRSMDMMAMQTPGKKLSYY
ncbi:MAG: hypothetical protein M1835_001297 [Candelina submexicana]|nr:MAG: hypothetical protein M1835_001297 [Candelina submexicana]